MRYSILIFLAWACACGDDDGVDLAPRLLDRGGVADAPIDGELHVYVVDSEDSAPIEGATIWLGLPDVAEELGTTDETGLLTYTGDLERSIVLSASAGGRASATWYGVEGANVTIPLRRSGSEGQSTATIRGTIAGWDDIPAPTASNHFLAALVDFSRGSDITGLDGLPQGTTNGIPDNACVKNETVSPPCAFELRSRTGSLALIAPILDVDNKGTPSDSDDEAEVVGFAYLTGLEIDPGETREGVVMETIDEDALDDLDVNFPSASGFEGDSAAAALDLGDDGLALVGLLDRDSHVARVPQLVGVFEGKSYWLVRIASETDGQSIGVSRHVTELPVDLPELLALPTFDLGDDAVSFARPDDAALVSVDFENEDGKNVYTALVLDDRDDVQRPTSDLLETTAVRVSVNAIDVEVDRRDFVIGRLLESVDGLASRRGDLE